MFTQQLYNLLLQVISDQFPVDCPIPVGAKLESVSLNNQLIVGQFASNYIGIWNLKGKLVGAVVFFY